MSVLDPLFLIGAGFNVDAKVEAGPIFGRSLYIGEFEIDCDYPLLGDVARQCFGVENVEGQSVEEMFAAAIEARNYEPIDTLAESLMKADYYIGGKLAFDETGHCYSTFLDRFGESSFLTFNYDSLLETLLFRRKRWYPHDGYGTPVDAEVEYNVVEITKELRSISPVLHLHGSLCIYESPVTIKRRQGNDIGWLTRRERPLYVFDPDSIGNLFAPFRSSTPLLGHKEPGRRVVAPVPDKTSGLQRDFVQAVYRTSLKLVRSSSHMICIGYNFNPLDLSSYDPVLLAFIEDGGRRLDIVSPTAEEVAERLSRSYSGLVCKPVPLTFRQWVEAGFASSD